jgi:TetR/AcrR family transcriptional regulator
MTISLPTRQKTGDRQIELVQAAVALAAQHSPAEITTSDLAKTIGITQGAVFRHFESKEAIWLAVVDWAHQALLNKLRRAAQAQEVDAVQALHDVFIAHIEFVKEYPGVPRLIFQELQHAKSTPLKDKARVLMADYRALVVGLLVQADTHGQLNPGLNTQAAAVLFMGAVQGLVMQSLVAGSMRGITAQAEAVFHIYEAGLLASSQPSVEQQP